MLLGILVSPLIPLALKSENRARLVPDAAFVGFRKRCLVVSRIHVQIATTRVTCGPLANRIKRVSTA